MKHLVIAGGGFAGFWSAMSAARQVSRLGKQGDLKITLVSKNEYFGIRPRFYEAELEKTRVPLTAYLAPLDIDLIIGEITDILPDAREMSLADGHSIRYDRLILATGSQVLLPDMEGREHLFSVDTFEKATALDRHLRALAASGFATPGARTLVVLGGGFTGLEIVAALPARMEALSSPGTRFAFHLIDRAGEIGVGYAPEARRHIVERLRALGIRVHVSQEGRRYQGSRLVLKNGEVLETETVVTAVGLRASPLTSAFRGPRDDAGRLIVDPFLRLPEHPDVLAAGDVAMARTDPGHYAVMSCQHAQPQGKFAGHNAVNLLFGEEPVPYAQPDYVTCLDLGPGDALLTTGWEREIKSVGSDAKTLKTQIVTEWIYPSASLEQTLAMAAPEIGG